MALPADFTLTETDGGAAAVLTGDWTARGLFDAGPRLAEALEAGGDLRLDLTGVNRCDTAGAYAILRAAGERLDIEKVVARKQVLRLLELVRAATQVEPQREARPVGFYALLERIGRGVFGLFADGYGTLVFLGHLLVALGRSVISPRRIRWAPIIALCERAGL
ncbi:MAG: ABC transporter permease, partial [Caulobacter vibrioides]